MPQDCELQRNQVVRMYPVLGSLPNECTLVPACARVALNRMAPRAYQIVQLRKLDNESVPVIFVKWSLLKVVLDKCWFQGERGLFLKTLVRRRSIPYDNTYIMFLNFRNIRREFDAL